MDESVSEIGFKALSNLHQFEEFYFMHKAYDSYEVVNYEKHFRLCMQYLPKLRYLGEQSMNLESAHFYKCLGKLTTKWLLEAKKPRTLALENMIMYKASSIPDGILLPNLTSLNLLKPLVNFHLDQRLSAVTELSIYRSTKETCVSILGHLGRQLEKIRVYVDENIPVDQLLTLCPNLDLLSYSNDYEEVTVASDIKSDTLRQLTALDLMFNDCAIGHTYGPEALLQLLQAPELRLLRLSMYSVDQQQVDEIIRRLQRQEILQNLEYACFWPPSTTDEDAKRLVTEQIKCLHSNMVFHCPKMNASCENVDFY